jgi:hypothetical protein
VDELSGVLFAIGLLTLLPAIGAAAFLNRRYQESFPTNRPFRWGYYLAAHELLGCAVLFLLIGYGAIHDGSLEAEWVVSAVVVGLYATPAYFLLYRQRWSWIALTILTLNPLTWIVNYIYGRRRWHELTPGFSLPDAPPWSGLRALKTISPNLSAELFATEARATSHSSGPFANHPDQARELSDAQFLEVLASKLSSLQALHEAGVLTAQEYETARRRLVDR